MKRILLLVMSYLILQSVKADDYSYLIVQKTDGTGVSLDVDQLSMTFSGGYLVAGDMQIAVSDLSKMFFSNDESESQVSYERITISEAGQATYCSDKALNFKNLTSLKAYVATGYDKTTGVIWLTRVKKVPAETGILIMADKGDYNIPTASVASVYENMFKGTLTETTIQTTETIDDMSYINYYLSDGDYGVGFYKVTTTDGVSISVNHCYLPIPKQSSAGTRGIDDDSSHFGIQKSDEVLALRLFNNNTTGIKEVKSGEVKSVEWFTLQGQRVNNPGKGIYIRNGKKILVK